MSVFSGLHSLFVTKLTMASYYMAYIFNVMNYALITEAVDSVQKTTAGSTTTIPCGMDTSNFSRTSWYGPPSFTTYSLTGKTDINPSLANGDRVSVNNATSDLIITNTSLSDEGIFRCTVVGTGVHDTELKVTGTYLGPKYGNISGQVEFQFNGNTTGFGNTNFISFPSGATLLAATYVNSSLFARDVSPRITFTGNWNTAELYFTLNSIISSDAGNIRLTVSGQLKEAYTLYVMGKPVTPTTSISGDPNVGDSVTLSCSSTSTTKPTGHGLAMLYLWSDGSTEVATLQQFTIFNVTIHDGQKQFTCKAKEQNGLTSDDSAPISITVIYGPMQTMNLNPSSTRYVVIEGSADNVLPDITCSAACNPDCSYSWTESSSNNAVLSFGKVDRNKARNYTCTAVNSRSGETDTVTVSVVVYYPPDVSVAQLGNKQNGTEGDAGVRIACNAQGVPDQYTFYDWIHLAPDLQTEIRHLPFTQSGNHNITYSFPRVSSMDCGVYICSVTNGQPDRNRETIVTAKTFLHIKARPQLLSTSPTTIGFKGRSAIVYAEFYSSDNNALVVRWYKGDDQNLVTGDDRYNTTITSKDVDVLFYNVTVTMPGYRAELHITNLQEGDFEDYVAEVVNEVGKAFTNPSRIRPQGAPDAPYDLKALDNKTSSSVTLTWKTGFHGGSDQTFHIEYQVGRNQNWTAGPALFAGQPEEGVFYSLTVENLSSDTVFKFRIYADNSYGRSEYSNSASKATNKGDVTQIMINKEVHVGAVVGGVFGGVLVGIVASVVIFIILRRRNAATASRQSNSRSRSASYNDAKTGATVEVMKIRDSVSAYEDVPKGESGVATYEIVDQDQSPKINFPNVATYEPLGSRPQGEQISMYDSLQEDIQGTTDIQEFYENTNMD